MEVKWTDKALRDLERLYAFLSRTNTSAAVSVVQALAKAPARLIANPRIGEQLFQFQPREVRRILAGNYEVRYEIRNSMIFVLRLWHTRENR